MKKALLFFLLSVSFSFAYANHIKGGFFTYRYLGAGISNPAFLRYEVTLTIYMECDPPPSEGQKTNPINFTLFDGATGAFLSTQPVNITNEYVISKNFDELCIQGDQRQCYYTIIVYNLPSIELAPRAGGYIFSYQRCCRISGIQNISGNSASVGNTYSIKIPGSSAPLNLQQNSSPRFQVNDTAVICGGSYFQYPFSATDPNSDSLSYYFCEAWIGGGTGAGSGPGTAAPDPSAPPSTTEPLSYPAVSYASGFSGSSPLGSGVVINPKTGLISGVAPLNNTGQAREYVVTVCIDEWKQGIKVGTTRKELHVKVGSCNPVQATPRGAGQPEIESVYMNCDTLQTSFFNRTPNSLIQSHFWDFGVAGQTGDTSSLAAPSFTYPDTGTYVVKLVVNRYQGCPDSSLLTVKVYPGFFAGFTINGICAKKPTQFFDTTRTRYGFVDSWNWDFGEPTSDNDKSTVSNPTYTYPAAGNKQVRFIVTSNLGCRDTVNKTVPILDKPPLDFRFRDTLICNGDTLQLHGIGNGNFSWTPSANMLNANTPDPTVYPSVTTVYTATLDDNGCINSDTVRVRVVNFVTLIGKPDTTICRTDSVQLGATFTNGLRFQWTPAADFTDPTLLNAVAHPTAASTTYTLLARIGHCIETAQTTVTTVPYPVVNAGADTTICYGHVALLRATTDANTFTWSPTNTLLNAGTLTPTANPKDSTRYILTVKNTVSGCPKPVSDTVLVHVLPKIIAFAGRDTAVVVNQPLQFRATGGVSYLWTPATNLSNANIADPIAVYDGSYNNIRYLVRVSNASGCFDTAGISVKVYRTKAQVFVPTAFTPNNDGLNDIVRPIAAGIRKIEYFRIYNRWGQEVFSTTINGKGWDGKINGKEQGTNVYVWLVKAVDYLGNSFFAKGTVTLIR